MAEATTLDQIPAERPNVASEYWHTHWFLRAFYALAVIWGLRNILYWKSSGLDVLMPIVFAGLLSWWAFVDASQRRHPIPILARAWFFLSAGIMVPAYVVWSRGWRGIGWMVLHVVLWYLLATAIMFIGGMLFFGDNWLPGI